jgi:hypothetical protein
MWSGVIVALHERSPEEASDVTSCAWTTKPPTDGGIESSPGAFRLGDLLAQTREVDRED